jgi:hypothetical protein
LAALIQSLVVEITRVMAPFKDSSTFADEYLFFRQRNLFRGNDVPGPAFTAKLKMVFSVHDLQRGINFH